MRRIVVGHDANGASVIASDAAVPGVDVPGVGLLTTLWSADAPALYPDAGQDPAAAGLYPPIGGCRLVVSRYAPGQRLGAAEGALADIPWEEDGMHSTDTTDLVLVLSGALTLTVDNGVERVLAAGDMAVMAGARHAWRNDGDAETVVAFFMVGAHRRGEAA
jgi:hypothetical protein